MKTQLCSEDDTCQGKTINTYILFVQEVVTNFYIVTYFMKWVTSSWTDSKNCEDVCMMITNSSHSCILCIYDK